MKPTIPPPAGPVQDAPPPTMWSLWLGVVLGFLLLTGAWCFLFRAAGSAHVESVPLAAPGGRP